MGFAVQVGVEPLIKSCIVFELNDQKKWTKMDKNGPKKQKKMDNKNKNKTK